MNRNIDRKKIARFGNLDLLAKQVVEGFITGMHKSPFHGFSVEFAEHRLYNKGESTRHIDWKLYARSGRLFTKKYEEETNLRCQIVIDCSSSMLYPKDAETTKLDYSVYAAASLIELLKRQRDAVGISLYAEEVFLHTECKTSVRHHNYLYAELERQLSDYLPTQMKSTNHVHALHTVAELAHKRSLVVVFSDFLDTPERTDEFFEAVQHLKHNKHEVIIFHVLDRKHEFNFEFENRPYELVDMESGDKIKLQPAELRELYQEGVKKYFHELEMRAMNYRVDFVTVDIQAGLEQVLLKYLLKRQKLF